jgi:chromosome segregation ATPase
LSNEHLHSHPPAAPAELAVPDDTVSEVMNIISRLVNDSIDMALLQRQQLIAKADLEIKMAELTRSQISSAGTKFPSCTEVQIKHKMNAENLCHSLTEKVMEKELKVKETSHVAIVKLSSVFEGSGKTAASQEDLETLRRDNRILATRCENLELISKKQETARDEMKSVTRTLQTRLEGCVSSFEESFANTEKYIVDRDRATSGREADVARREREIDAKLYNIEKRETEIDAKLHSIGKREMEIDAKLHNINSWRESTNIDLKDGREAVKTLSQKNSESSKALESLRQDVLTLKRTAKTSPSLLPDVQVNLGKLQSVSDRLDCTDQSVKGFQDKLKTLQGFSGRLVDTDQSVQGLDAKLNTIAGHVTKLLGAQDKISKDNLRETTSWRAWKSEYSKRLGIVESGVTDTNASIASLKDDLSVSKKEILGTRELTIAGLNVHISNNTQQLAAHHERLSSAETRLATICTLEDRISSIESKENKTVSDTIEQLQAQLENLTPTTRSLVSDVSGISERLRRVEGLSIPETSNTSNISSRLDMLEVDLQKDLESMEKTLGDMMDEIKVDAKRLESSVKAQADQFEKALSQISSADAQKVDLEGRLSTFHERLKPLEDAQFSNLKSQASLQISDVAIDARIKVFEEGLVPRVHSTFATKAEVTELEQRLRARLEPRLQQLANHCEANGLALADLDARYTNINTTDFFKAMVDQFSTEVFPQLAQLRESLDREKAKADSLGHKINDLERTLSSQMKVLKRDLQDEQAVRKEASSEISALKTEVALNKKATADLYFDLKTDFSQCNNSSKQDPPPLGTIPLTGKRKFDILRGDRSPRSSHFMSPHLTNGHSKGSPGPSILRAKKAKTDIERPMDDEKDFFALRPAPISDGED